MTEYVTNIPVEKLKPFPDHPFQVRDDDSMKETVENLNDENTDDSEPFTRRI